MKTKVDPFMLGKEIKRFRKELCKLLDKYNVYVSSDFEGELFLNFDNQATLTLDPKYGYDLNSSSEFLVHWENEEDNENI